MLLHNFKIELIDNDKAIKLTQILNDLNVRFTVDNLSKVLEIMFTLYIDNMNIDSMVKLVEKLGYTEIFGNQDITTIIKTLEKLMFEINQTQEVEVYLKTADRLKYNDLLDMLFQASMKLYEKIKVEMIHEDFTLSIQGGLNISAMRQMESLKHLTIGSMKTMNLWNFYFVDN